jgi:acyl-CoA dehydrogenase
MPLEFIIGGPKMAGQGWRMLMECLAAGRSISLPAPTPACRRWWRAPSAPMPACAPVQDRDRPLRGRRGGAGPHRRQHLLSDAARVMTAGAIDLGEKPSVVSAIVKYHVTERARQTVNDGMDVIGGKGICLGPQNFLGRAYQQIPVGITVEGANILTRSLILFGQGAIRCHPYVLKEMHAAQQGDLQAFDKALWGTSASPCRTPRARWSWASPARTSSRCPHNVAPETRRYYQQLTRFSAAFAFIADISMGTMGGALKRKEKLSARLGDILSLMYLATATLKRYESEGRQAPTRR